jgi:hypothetical protein
VGMQMPVLGLHNLYPHIFLNWSYSPLYSLHSFKSSRGVGVEIVEKDKIIFCNYKKWHMNEFKRNKNNY